MAEDHNWEEASNHTLCANNCGFFGNTTMHNLCSKCYNDHCLKQQQLSTAKIAVEKSLLSQSQQPPQETSSISSIIDTTTPAIKSTDALVHDHAPDVGVLKTQPRNRCGSCKRRVGLTGFTCRCGTTFCGIHRYPEKHGCTFDYKTMGKEAIAKANPVVKAAKLDKI